MEASNLKEAFEIFLTYDSDAQIGYLSEVSCLYLSNYDESKIKNISSEEIRHLEQLGWGLDSNLRWTCNLG